MVVNFDLKVGGISLHLKAMRKMLAISTKSISSSEMAKQSESFIQPLQNHLKSKILGTSLDGEL